jgi:FkbM family methyltransferase
MTHRHVPPGIQQDLVYDVGMHRGEDTAFYLSRGYRVVGIEANTRLVEVLRERFREEESDGRVVILPVAVGPREGSASFAAAREATVFSTADPAFLAWARSFDIDFDVVEVEMTTLDAVMDRYGTPYFLKVDIEGMDVAAVERLGSLEVRPPLLSIESVTAGPKATIPRVLDEVQLLRRLGYRQFKLVNQLRIAELDGTVLDREGQPVVFSAGTSASGPFGDEAPGRWRHAWSVTPMMFGRLLHYHALADAGWFPSTRVGRTLREKARSLQSDVSPRLHAGRYLGGYGLYDLHAAL